MMLWIKRITLLILFTAPLVAWAVVKPVRVVVPELLGLTCYVNVCVDDPARLAQAQALYEEAVLYVDAHVGHLQTTPRAIFCSTRTCAERFGFDKPMAGYNVGTIGIVLGPRGWHDYFVRH